MPCVRSLVHIVCPSNNLSGMALAPGLMSLEGFDGCCLPVHDLAQTLPRRANRNIYIEACSMTLQAIPPLNIRAEVLFICGAPKNPFR